MDFDEAFHKLLGHEGGYSNHPNDPGGETMWGVTARVARAHGYHGPMRELPVAIAKKIYKEAYWDAVSAELIPEHTRYAVFDAAVNSGPVQAIKWLQRARGVEDVGRFGPKTTAAVAVEDETLEARFLGHRLMFMANLKNWDSFSEGWAKRIAQILIEK